MPWPSSPFGSPITFGDGRDAGPPDWNTVAPLMNYNAQLEIERRKAEQARLGQHVIDTAAAVPQAAGNGVAGLVTYPAQYAAGTAAGDPVDWATNMGLLMMGGGRALTAAQRLNTRAPAETIAGGVEPAAYLVNGNIYIGKIHADALNHAVDAGEPNVYRGSSGFLTTSGSFISREAAQELLGKSSLQAAGATRFPAVGILKDTTGKVISAGTPIY